MKLEMVPQLHMQQTSRSDCNSPHKSCSSRRRSCKRWYKTACKTIPYWNPLQNPPPPYERACPILCPAKALT